MINFDLNQMHNSRPVFNYLIKMSFDKRQDYTFEYDVDPSKSSDKDKICVIEDISNDEPTILDYRESVTSQNHVNLDPQ